MNTHPQVIEYGIVSRVSSFVMASLETILATIGAVLVTGLLVIYAAAVMHFEAPTINTLRVGVISLLQTSEEKSYVENAKIEVAEMKAKLDAALIPEATVSEAFSNHVSKPVVNTAKNTYASIKSVFQ